MDFAEKSVRALFQIQSELDEAFATKGIVVPTTAVENFAKHLFIEALGWSPALVMSKGHHASSGADRFHIRGFKQSQLSESTVLMQVNLRESPRFEHLALMVFDENLKMISAGTISVRSACQITKVFKGVHRLTWSEEILEHSGFNDISEIIRPVVCSDEDF